MKCHTNLDIFRLMDTGLLAGSAFVPYKCFRLGENLDAERIHFA